MAEFPPPPTPNVDFSKLTFGVTDVNCHVESTYTRESGSWSTPKLVKNPYITLHGMAPALNYGHQAFEGLKAFRQPSGSIGIFRPQKNAARLQEAASFLTAPPVSTEHFLECVHLAVGANAEFVPPAGSEASMYIRPMLLGASPQLSLTPPSEFRFLVYVYPTGSYHGVKPVDALILDDYDRAAPNGSGSYKVGGNYAPVFKFSHLAHEQGFGVMLHLDSKTHTTVDEFTTSGFIGIKSEGENVTVVASDSKSVLKSITADSALEMARSYGWKVERREIPFEEIATFDEVIAAGTAATLVPVRSITRREGDYKTDYMEKDKEGIPACTKKLLEHLRGIQSGSVKDTFGWLDIVKAPDQKLSEA